ncbi:YhaN family protein [Allorhodopirellula solitaria]|uniref:YhaN AAA domain-containing protein n=1 Tax=Allorhodopirellula solitaria TaxID=2527987 RepID=A0A5C5X8I6_9BACT|nr:YhaN family protein [Allorhodopirellula solitaria]TWT59240.1 hypothetical protein CA85_39360 [Allorhodopirellula solitaria]
MIIQRLDLIAYGRFTDTRIDLSAGPRRFHIIYGPNESGKSTSLRAITSLLYGMTTRAEDDYLHPKTKIRVGGVLEGAEGTSLECIRRRGRKGTLRQTDDSTVIPDADLDALLGGVDREAFEHRFGLSHDELVQGGKAILEGEGDLGEILFAAGAGVSQLKAVQTKIDNRLSELFVAGGSKGAINILSREITEKKRELEKAKILPREWADLQRDLKTQQATVTELEDAHRESAVRLSKLRAFENALPLVPRWRSMCQELDQLSDAPLLDDAFSERRRKLDSDRQIALRQSNSNEISVSDLQQELERLGDDSVILIHEADIESLFHRLGEREKARTDCVELQRKRKNLDRRMMETLAELSIEINEKEADAATQQIDASLKRLHMVDSVRTRVNGLAQQYAMLVRQRDDADEDLRSLQRDMAEVEKNRKSGITPDDPSVISQIIESVGSPDSVLANLAQQTADAKQSRLRCEQLARKLDTLCPKTEGSFADSITAAARLTLPSEQAVDAATQSLHQRENALQYASEKFDQLETSERSLADKLASAGTLGELPTAEQLGEARGLRDEKFCSIVAGYSSQSVSTEDFTRLQALIRKSDELVDTMRQHHEQVHLQASIQNQINDLGNQKATVRSIRDDSQTDLNSAHRDWQALWQPIGIAAGDPPTMERWTSTHAQLVESVSQYDEETERVNQIQTRIASACQRLRRAISSAVVDQAQQATLVHEADQESARSGEVDESTSDSNFSILHDQAIQLRTQLQHARKRYDERVKQHDSLRAELPKAEARLESRQNQLDRWDSDWADATSALAADVDRTPAVVLEKIAQIDGLNAQKRERDIVLHRIRAMLDDDNTYRSDLARLATSLGSEFGERDGEIQDAFRLVKDFFERLQTERSATTQRAKLQQQLDTAQHQLAAARKQVADADVSLGRLCEEAACQSPDQLIEVEQRSKQRQQVEQSKHNVEQQLRLLAGSIGFEEFVQEVAQQQTELLAMEIDQLENKLAGAREQLAQSQQTLGGLQERMARIDGSDQAAEQSQELQFLTGKIDNHVDEYSRVKIASMILRRAIDDYRQENQGPVLQLASTTFEQLTRGEYTSLKVDFDGKGKAILFGVRSADEESDVPAHAMSTGTADALYLSLRLASIDHQLTRGTPLPLVIDDCLVQLDDHRSAAAMRTLSDLSLRTQVILFTHHEHLIELAGQTLGPDEFHVQRLGEA